MDERMSKTIRIGMRQINLKNIKIIKIKKYNNNNNIITQTQRAEILGNCNIQPFRQYYNSNILWLDPQ